MSISSLFQLGDPGYLSVKKLTVGNTVVANAISNNWATATEVASGKQFIDANGELTTGSLQNFGPLETRTVTAGTVAKQIIAATGYRGFATITINPTPTMAATVNSSTLSQTIIPTTGKFLSQVTINPINTITRANTNITATVNSTNNTIIITAGNNQSTGYVTGSNATAQATVSLTINRPTLDTTTGKVVATAKAQFNNGATISKTSTSLDLQLATYSSTNNIVNITQGYLASAAVIAIPTVARANTNLTTSTTTNGLVITAKNEQGTGYVYGATKTGTKTINLNIGNPTIDENGVVTAIATISDQSTSPITQISKNVTLDLGKGSATVSGKDVTISSGYYSSATTLTLPSGSVSTNANIVTVNKGYYTATTTVTLNEGAQRASLLFTPGNGNVSVVSSNVSLTATTNTPASGYYITASGYGGVNAISVASITTSGYLTVGSTSTTSATTSNIATQYYTLPSGDVTISGGALTKGAGSVSATGTNIVLIATSKQPTSDYYITASGFGRVNRSDITKTNTPGYISAKTATVLAGTSEVSNVATVYYTISTEEKTVTASTTAQVVEPSNGKLISKITINAIPVYDGSLEVQ